MGDKTWLAFMQKVRSHPKTKRKNKEPNMNMITVDQETLMRMIAQAVEAEREACAKFCETNQVWVGKGKRGFSEWGEDEFVTGGIHQGMDYAAAIRARKDK
jgi:hypothetical protein